MTRSRKSLLLFVFVAFAGIALLGQSLVSEASKNATFQNAPVAKTDSTTTTSSSNTANQDALKANYGKLPMSFERNVGQTDEAVKFFSHGRGYNLFITPAEAVFVLSRSSRAPTDKNARAEEPKRGRERRRQTASVLRIKLKDANAEAHLEGLNELPTKSNYYIGKDPQKWRTGVPHYLSVWAESVYPGISVHYYGNQSNLEYDFVVEPKIDPQAITLAIEGADTVEIDSNGDLVLSTAVGQLRQRKPFVYQEVDGARKEVSSKYVVKNKNEIGFELGPYDRNKRLIIDPQLTYSTYLGGNAGEVATGIGVDDQGNAYVTGTATSVNFPTTTGAFDRNRGDLFYEDAFVAKLNPTGTALLYSTFIGGIYGDDADDIAVDGKGNAFITGGTSSPDYPVTFNAYQPVHAGIDPADEDLQNVDVFVTKFTNQGTLVYSTFLGGDGFDNGFSIAVDDNGNAIVAGSTDSANYPLTADAFQTTPPNNLDDAFVSKLSPAGSGLQYSTYLGGTSLDRAFAVAVDSETGIYVAGQTLSANFPNTDGRTGPGFLTKLDTNLPGGVTLVFSNRISFIGQGVAVDGAGKIYVAGDDVVEKTDEDGEFPPLYSATLRNGSINDIAVDKRGTAFVTGSTSSSSFPATAGGVQPTYGGAGDAFIAKLKPSNGLILYASYLGGSD
ncbi:MAG TPA: SBBP repeat-containing protein, partial [Anaerolineales bacterium]|nr:SBBP repeat-containing protein [Anaerolineales bacterium]